MADAPLRCPSCGAAVPVAGTPCPTCGFTVRRADGDWDDRVVRGAGGDALATAGATTGDLVDAAVDEAGVDAVDGAVDGGGGAADWAPTAPSPPPRAVAPPAWLDPPSPPGLGDGIRTIVPDSAADWQATSLDGVGARTGPPTTTAAGSTSPPTTTTAGYSGPAIGTARGRSGPPLSLTAARAAAAGVAPLGNEPSWWHESPGSAGLPAVRRRRASGRPRIGAAVVMIVVLIVAARAAGSLFVGGTPSAGPPSQPGFTVTMPAPDAAALAAVRHKLSALAGVASPAGHVHGTPAAAAAKARRLRVALILWRDAHGLDDHQLGVLGHAIAYAGALRRSLAAPHDAARGRAAARALHAWLADDPFMKVT
ncbi:MAG TPA: zinc ribbon domain-containing protein [Thermoleophilia bacterium]|nr:zinc ribbon domain-containing protein [Thermoleophilia bacterium]